MNQYIGISDGSIDKKRGLANVRGFMHIFSDKVGINCPICYIPQTTMDRHIKSIHQGTEPKFPYK
jgi:hypothetical protein